MFAPSSKQVAVGEASIPGGESTKRVTLFGTEAPYASQAVYPVGGVCLSYSKQGDLLAMCSIFSRTLTVWDVLPGTDPSCPASGVVVSVGGAPVAGVPVSAAALNEVVAGPVFSLSVLPPPMRNGAFHFANSVVPATTDIELSCCGSATACEFYVVSYNCGDCMASDMNGGFPSVLPTAGFDAGSCSPWFTVNDAGPVEHPDGCAPQAGCCRRLGDRDHHQAGPLLRSVWRQQGPRRAVVQACSWPGCGQLMPRIVRLPFVGSVKLEK